MLNFQSAESFAVGTMPAAFGVLAWLWRIERKLDRFFVEHEMLMGDFAERKHMRVSELPTRSRARF